MAALDIAGSDFSGKRRRAAATSHRPARFTTGSALVRALREELLGLPGPELRDGLVGLHGPGDLHVAEDRVLYLLDLGDIDVLDRVVVFVELQRPARRLDLHRAHRLQERRAILDIAVDRIDRRLGPQPG